MWSLERLKAKVETISSLEHNLNDVQSKTLTESAILVPIIVQNGVPFVLLTVRSMHLTNYPGQVSFPGGKRDPEDADLVATALRETKEEIGMSSEHLRLLGTLIPYETQTNFLVTPVVAEVVDYEIFSPRINPFEVCEILKVPLEYFILEKYHKCRMFSRGKDSEKDINVDYFEFADSAGSVHIIWGLTALIATHVATLLFERTPQFQYQEWLSGNNKRINKNKLYQELISNTSKL